MTIQEYIKSTRRLVKSILFKLDDMAAYMELAVLRTTGKKAIRKRDMKYYLNIAGIRHFTNNPIYVSIGETIVEFNKELLATNTAYKDKLLQYGSEYDSLLEQNPLDTLLIKGILFNINQDTALNAEDGDILHIEDSLLTENEKDLKYEIQEFIKRYLESYYKREYLIDDLYLPTALSTLYSILPNLILVRRLDRVRSYRVDTFHIENYFKSYKHLTNTDLFIKTTELKLYEYIPYLRKFAGMKESLDTLAKQILDNEGIGVSIGYVEKLKPTLIEDDLQDLTKKFYQNRLGVQFDPINASGKFILRDRTNINTILELEKELGYIPDDVTTNEILEKYRPEEILGSNKVITKLLSINQLPVIELALLDPALIVWFNLIYVISNNKLIFTDQYVNMTDIKQLTVTNENILYILIKYILTALEVDTSVFKLGSLTYDSVLNITVNDIDVVVSDLTYPKAMKEFLYDHISKLPNIKDAAYTSITDFANYVTGLIDMLRDFRKLLATANDYQVMSDIKILINRIFKSGTVVYEDSIPIDSVLDNYDTTFRVDKDLGISSFRDLIRKIFGVEISKSLLRNEIVKNYMELATKFTSYTVHFVNTDIAATTKNPYKGNNIVSNTLTGINRAEFGTFRNLEKSYSRYYTYSSSTKFHLLGIDSKTLINIEAMKVPTLTMTSTPVRDDSALGISLAVHPSPSITKVNTRQFITPLGEGSINTTTGVLLTNDQVLIDPVSIGTVDLQLVKTYKAPTGPVVTKLTTAVSEKDELSISDRYVTGEVIPGNDTITADITSIGDNNTVIVHTDKSDNGPVQTKISDIIISDTKNSLDVNDVELTTNIVLPNDSVTIETTPIGTQDTVVTSIEKSIEDPKD